MGKPEDCAIATDATDAAAKLLEIASTALLALRAADARRIEPNVTTELLEAWAGRLRSRSAAAPTEVGDITPVVDYPRPQRQAACRLAGTYRALSDNRFGIGRLTTAASPRGGALFFG